MHQPLPISDRLRFREYKETDASSLLAVFSDPYARRFYPEHSKPEKLAAWIEWNKENYALHGFGLWVIEVASSGRFAGDAGLTLQSVEGGRLLEIGYHVHPELRGQGLASEAARACLSWAFAHTEHELVCCVVDPENTASVRVAEKLHRFKRTFQGRTKEMFLFYTTRAAWDGET